MSLWAVLNQRNIISKVLISREKAVIINFPGKYEWENFPISISWEYNSRSPGWQLDRSSNRIIEGICAVNYPMMTNPINLDSGHALLNYFRNDVPIEPEIN